jgi:hypothetical protein
MNHLSVSPTVPSLIALKLRMENRYQLAIQHLTHLIAVKLANAMKDMRDILLVA